MKTVRELINRDIILEKGAKSPDKGYIQTCQNLLDNLKGITHKDFIDTGRIMTKENLMERYPNVKLHDGTESVCKYVGGFCIEFRDGNLFSWAWHKDKSISHIEHSLFNYVKDSIYVQEG